MKFLNTHEIISAGTDGQLKLWDINKPPFCLRSFVGGHVNEKNFVGLATNGDYIACGSEDNSLCIYYKVRTLNFPLTSCNLQRFFYFPGTFKAAFQPEVRLATAAIQRLGNRQQNRFIRQWIRVCCLLEEKFSESPIEHNHRRQLARHHKNIRTCVETLDCYLIVLFRLFQSSISVEKQLEINRTSINFPQMSFPCR